ncbi:D-alanyl-D-alanine carboxypeptidase family protein, partial [Rhodoferax sp.]|uniref:M15 family metallopeptidase n=1 Tax=Rhodoferax sp. TaxID=50421 RepID=UPI002768BEC3|nr:M15 family metallopeptidase [Rhodoferax sp.]
QADGIDLFIVSAFRSVERQAEIVRRKLASGQSLETILAVSAPPGFSEHHSGRAVDLSTPGVAPLEPAFDQSPAFAWLVQRAAVFGFRLSFPEGNAQGYQYEPWHWCFEAP